jgi:hypothetical protein
MGNSPDAASEGPFAPDQGQHFRPFPGSIPSGESRESIIDNEHLKLLRIGYFISAAQTAIFIPVGLLYAGMGVLFTHLPSGPGAAPPPFMTWFFGAFGGVFALIGIVGATLKLLTAIRLKERRSRTLCLITAGLSCLEIPYGTALGVMTFIVLGRPSVREQFDAHS